MEPAPRAVTGDMIRRLLPLALLLLGGACDPCTGIGSCVAPQVRYDGIVRRGQGVGRPLLPAEGLVVKFVPTGGVALRSDTVEGRTDSEGRFRLEADAAASGTVTGDLLIYPPAPLPPERFEGLTMHTSRGAGDLRRLGEWQVPYPHVGYQFRLFYHSNGAPARGVEVVFRRTGGVALSPDTFRTVTDPRGYVIYVPDVRENGIAVGDLTVYPIPPHRPFTVNAIRLRTVTEARFDSVFNIGIGDRLPYSAIIVWADTGEGIEGVQVEFRRTGGIPLANSVYSSVTDRFGTAAITPVPLGSGTVRGDLVITPPAPGVPVVVRDVVLKTETDDRPLQLLGFFGVERAKEGSEPGDEP